MKTLCEYFSFAGNLEDTAYSRDGFLHTYSQANGNISAICVYNNCNSQRDDTSKPVFSPYFTRTAQTTAWTLRYGINTTNTDDKFLPNYAFASKLVFQLGSDGGNSELYKILNPLVSYATDNSINNNRSVLINEIDKYVQSAIYYIKQETLPTETFRRRLDCWMRYFEYKKGIGSLADMYAEFSEYLSTIYVDINTATESQLQDAYNVVGTPFVGRMITLARELMDEYQIGSTEYNNLKNVLIKYADMFCTHWETHHYIGIKGSVTSSVANSLASALYGIAIAISLTDDNERYVTNYAEISTEIEKKLCVGTIFVESDSILNRYLHYAVYTNYLLALSKKYYSDATQSMTNPYIYAFSSSTAMGQLRELEETSSDSRRAMASNYAYTLCILAMSDDAGAVALSTKVLDWLFNQNSVVGIYPQMLDGYVTYEDGVTNISNLEFAIGSLIDLKYQLQTIN